MVYAGTIIEINQNKTYVITMDYSVVALRTKKDYILGEQITFSKWDKYPELLHGFSRKTMSIAAAFILLVTATVAGTSFFGGDEQAGFDTVCTALVSVDINPSIEISINKEEQIVSAEAKNEDGTKLLATLDLDHKKLVDGVNEIIAAAKEMGYIDESKKVVLVSAALYDSVEGEVSSAYAEQLKAILNTIEAESDDTDLLTVYINDSAIIQEAKENDLSIGKELLYQYAKTQDAALTAEEIRTAALAELLDKLNALAQNGDLVEDLQNGDPAGTGDVVAEEEKTEKNKEEAATTKTEPVEEPVVSSFSPTLKVGTGSTTISFDWTGVSSPEVTYGGKIYYGFKYYKVVASSTNDHPVYPDDGYLMAISDSSKSELSINPASGNYNCSPELVSGETYYVAITYVFENGKFTSNTKTVTVPAYSEAVEAPSVSSLNLSVSSSAETLAFSWTPVGASSMTYNGTAYKNFSYYKVVASQTNASPKYPDDGYLTYISDYNASSWSLNPAGEDYNQSPTLVSGETYYFAITYVFENGKAYSNTVQYQVP